LAGRRLSLQQFLELLEVVGHGVPDTWHGDSPEQAARAAEFELDRVRDADSLWDGVQDISVGGRPTDPTSQTATDRSGCPG
jgi:hypothetical protein